MKYLVVLIIGFTYNIISAQEVIKLYEGKAPGSEDWTWTESVSEDNAWNTKVVYNVSQPTMTAYIPPYYLATGTAIIIAPGGGFHGLSIDSEGNDLALWLQSRGVAAFVLKYRLVHSATDDPVKELYEKTGALDDMKAIAPLAMQDGLKAIEYIRTHAEDYDIDPKKIGIIGFSAGGTVALDVAYNATSVNMPNFIAPIYASTRALVGGNLPSESTPMFLAVAQNDQLGLAPKSVQLYNDWTAANYPAELHIYQRGGHGFGMRKNKLPTDNWFERFGEWLHVQGYLKKLYPNRYEKLYGQEAFAQGMKDKPHQLAKNYAQLDRYKASNEELNMKEKKKNSVVFLGNSITEGWVAMDPDFFKENNFIGRGISGQTSPQLLLRFRSDVIDLRPTAVVIHIGTNDVAENTGPYDPDYTMNNIASMVDLAKAHDIKVILATVVPSTKFEWNRKLGDRSDIIVDLNDRIKQLAKKENTAVADYHTAMSNDKNGMDPEIAEDGVHPNDKGYEIMKSVILPVIKETLNH